MERRVIRGGRGWGRGFRALTLASVFTLPAAAQSPQGGNVAVGSAGITSQGNQTLITQTSNRALIDWRSFDIGAGQGVTVTQPGTGSLLVNRVTGGGTGTRIDGSLTANGQVVVIDKAGIVLGRGARIDAGAFLATTADIDNADVAAGRLIFGRAGLAGAAVVNEGTIRVADGGYAVLAAPEVRNSGLVEARLGRVVLAGAERFTLDLAGDGLLRFEVPGELAGRVLNDGTLTGAQVLLTAQAARNGMAGVVNAGGLVEATTARQVDGRIIIGGEGTDTNVTGTVRAEAGAIDILGRNVLLQGATVDASGPDNGGSIRIGGDYQGGGALARAQTTRIDAGSRVSADGAGGDGGRIIVWSDGRTVHQGAISARGARDGGFAEVSGKGSLTFAGTADLAGGAGGTAGQLLLDPTNITVGATPDLNGDSTTGDDLVSAGDLDNSADQGAVTSQITAAALAGLLNNGTSVTLAASNDINIDSAIAKTGGGNAGLTLNAGRDVSFASGVGVSSSSGRLDLNVTAGRSILATGGSFNSNGGAVSLMASGSGATTGIALSGASFQTGSGNLTLSGTGSGTGVSLAGDSRLSTGFGDLSITGHGVVGVDFAYGTATTGSGDLSITGTASGGTTGAVGIRLDRSTGGGISSNNGDVRLSGTGAGSAGGANNGVLLTGGFVATAGSGDLSVTATGGSGSVGLMISGSGTLGGAAQTGTVTLISDAVALAGGTVQSSGRVQLRTNSNARDLIIGGTDDSAGLALSTAELGTVSAGTLTLGHDQHSGAVTVLANPSASNIGSIELISGSLNAGAAIVGLLETFLNAGKDAALETGSGTLTISSNISKSAGGNATLSARARSDLTASNISIGASTGQLNIDFTAGYNGSGGSLTANSSTIAGNGGAVTLNGLTRVTLSGSTVTGGAGAVTLAGNDIALTSDNISSTGRVWLRPYSAGAATDIGATGVGSGVLNLSLAELGQVSAGMLRLGSLDGGDLVVSATLTHASDIVELASAGQVTQSAAIQVANLSLLGTGGAYTLRHGSNNISVLAANTGSVDFRNSTSFSVGSVVGTTGLTFSGDASLYAADPLITLAAAATHTGSGTGTLTLSGDIDVTVSANIGTTGTGRLNIVLAADGNEAGASGRVLVSGATLATNGGNITIGSGSTPATRAAEGKADTGIGVNITGSTLNSGSGGNILINGDGAPSGSNSATGIGVNVTGSSLIAAGSGTITLNGTGGAGNSLTAGIAIGNGSTIRSATGAIAINGTQAATGTDRYGILLRDDPTTRSAIYSTGGGGLGLTATGGLLSANGGAADSSRAYIGWDGTTAYGGTVTLTADNMRLTSGTGTAAISIGGSGNLVIRPASAGASIALGDGAVGASTLELGQAELDTLRAGFASVTVGRSDGTGAVTVSGAAFKDNTSIAGGSGAVTIAGALSTGNGSDAGTLSVTTTGLLTVSAAVSTQNQDISLNSDRLALTGSLNAGTAAATLTTATAARTIDLGALGDTGAGLEISSAELNRVTAGTVRVGSANAGAIGVTAAIAPTGTGTLHLISGAGISQTGAISISNLALTAGGTVALASVSNDVTSVAVTTGSSNANVALRDDNGFAIATVDGVTGANVGTGNLALTSGSTVTQSAAITAGGLSLTGAGGAYTLAHISNAVARIAADTGSIDIGLSGAVSIGTVGSVTGIATTGTTILSSGGNLTLAAGASVATNGAGDALVLAANGTFTNNATGAGALSVTGGGRFLVFSNSPLTSSVGAVTALPLYNHGFTFAGRTYTAITNAGNRFVYTYAPTLTVTPDNVSRTYTGATITGLTSTITGLVTGDALADAVTGAAAITGAGRNVGTYTLTAGAGTLASDLGYGFSFGTGTLTVTRKDLTYAVANSSAIYGTTATGGAVTLTGVVDGDTVAGTVTTYRGTDPVTLADRTGVGSLTQQVTALTGADAGNYQLATTGNSNGTLTIATRELTYAVAAVNSTYGTLATLGTASLTGVVAGDTVTTNVSLSGATLSDRLAAGTYGQVVTLGGSDAANYVLATSGNNAGSLVVARKPVTFTIADVASTYGTLAVLGTPSLTGVLSGDNLGGTIVLSSGTLAERLAAGTYGLTLRELTGGSAANYVLATSGNNDGLLRVAPKVLTADIAAVSSVYGQTPATGAVTLTGLLAGDDVTAGLVVEGAGGTVTLAPRLGVGTYSQRITGLTGAAVGNYRLSNGDTARGTLTVTPAALTVTAASLTKIYGTDDPALTYVVTGLVDGDSLSGTLARVGGQNAGTYAINQGSLNAGANYNLAFTGGTLTINPAALTVVAGSGAKTYGDADPVLSFTATGLVNGDSLTGTLARDAGENAGTYTVTQGSLSAGANYNLIFTAGSLTVNPAALTVTANAASRIYQDADPALTYAVSGLRRGDSAATALSGSLSRAAGEDVGTYAISQGSLTANANYNLTFTAADFSIRPANLMLSVVAGNLSKTYGDGDPTLTFTSSGLRGQDSLDRVLTGSLSRAAGEDAGIYAINQGSLASINPNYVVSFTPGTLTINPANLSVAAAMVTRTYGEGDPALTYSVAGLRRGDSAGAILSGSLGRAAGEDAGAYAISQGSLTLNNGNYVLSFTGSQFIINPALLSVAADAATRAYGAADPALTYAVTGLRRGDAAGAVLSGGLVRAAGADAGRYAIGQGTLTANGNYRIAFTGADFTITPVPLSVLVDNVTRQLGAANPSFTARFQGLVNGDGVAALTGLSFQTAADAGSLPGSYAISAGGISNGNYQITYVDGVLTVTGGGVLPPAVADAAPVTTVTRTVPPPTLPAVATPVALAAPVVAQPPTASAVAAPTGDGGSAALAAVNQQVQSASGSNADDDSAAEEMIPGLLSQQRRLPGETPEGTPGLDQQFPNLGRVW